MNAQQRILMATLALLLAAGAIRTAHGAEQGMSNAPATPAPAQSQPSTGAAASSAATADSELLNLKAGEIAGREVYNSEGKELGKVDMIGRDRTTGNLSAIISVGGFLGFGGSKVAMPIEQLALQDNKLVASTPMSKKELSQQASAYQEKRYEAVADDTTLSQVASTTAPASVGSQAEAPVAAPGAMGAASFQNLDSNSDGYLTSDEVSGNQTIIGRWRNLDTNNDGRLDQAEFSAFEQSWEETRPSGDDMRERAPSSAPGPTQ